MNVTEPLRRRALGLILAISAIATLAVTVHPGRASAATIGPWYGPFEFTNNTSGRCLDAAATGQGANGTPVQLWDCYPPAQTNQMWYLVLVRDTARYGDAYQLRSLDGGRCLDAAAQDGGQNGAHIQLWDCLGANQLNQLWWVYRNSTSSPYIIENVASHRVLDAAAQYGGVNGTPVQLWDDLGDFQYNQRWTMLRW
jgi:hypothetical protein